MPQLPPRKDPPSPSKPRTGVSVISLPEALCSECGNRYRQEIKRMNTGKVTGITLHCDTCFHAKEVSIQYVQSTSADWQPPLIECATDGCSKRVVFARGIGFKCEDGHKAVEDEILELMHQMEVSNA
jgi:hypothetical protein